MNSGIGSFVLEVARRVSSDLGGVLDVSTTRWISRPDGKELIKDSTLALYIDGKKSSDDVVLLISNEAYPDAVAEDIAKARNVESRVSPAVARHIVVPVSEGRFENRSYAAFPRLSSLSQLRVVRQFQKGDAAGRVLPWLAELANDTRHVRDDPAEYERYFITPIRALLNDQDQSAAVREFAADCLDFTQGKQGKLFTVVQHGDFWIGNVFFTRRSGSGLNPLLGDFRVIDWRGSWLDGYACADLIRFCASIYRPESPKIDYLIDEYCSKIGISQIDMGIYCCAALGRLGAELEHFPKHRFCGLCDRTVELLRFRVPDYLDAG